MNIIHTQYVQDKQRLEIYLAGCMGIDGKHCPNCHNPQSWSFEAGQPADMPKLLDKASQSIVKNIWILGGEPLDQHPSELFSLLYLLNKTGKHIWLFTRYELNKIPANIMLYCDYIKTGQYKQELSSYHVIEADIELASDNQKLYKIGVDNQHEMM